MKIYESGRESGLLKDMKEGTKTIEVRLNKGKFARYKIGDRVRIREDIYQEGELVESKPEQLLVEITKIGQYPTFEALFKKLGYRAVVPRAQNVQEALDQAHMFYQKEDELKYGVLAIHFKVV